MASLAQRLTFWLFGLISSQSNNIQNGGETAPRVPHPKEIRPIILETRFMLNLKIPLEKDTTREKIIDLVNASITDEEMQAHGLQAMKDELGMEFDRKLNPHMPEPRYWAPKA